MPATTEAGATSEPGTTLDPKRQAEIEVALTCAGLTIVEDKDGLQITTSPEDAVLMYGDLEEALKFIGSETGCWREIEVSKIVGTRSLDGRVESASGRASWTYHPDNGLDILCVNE